MATLFKRPEPRPGQPVYTVDLPGAADLFKFIIPALNDKALKKERIKRMREHKSTVPDFLQWIPPVITQIDDAQDLLTTALWLAKPLIKRLPTRFVPFVGWALTISDAANLINMILGMSMTPGLTKPDAHKKFKNNKFGKKDMTKRVADFLKPGGWKRKFGDIIQAAQASETVTGIGLTLGSVMGAASDFIWAPYRLARGERVEFRLPPEGDPATKAYRFLTQTPQQFWAKDILSPEDHAILLAAQSMATGIALDSGIQNNDERINDLMQSQCPVYIPWDQPSIEALQEEGFDLSRENYYKPYIPKDKPTFSEAIDLSFQSIGTVFPHDWTPQDPLPPGVTVAPGYSFPGWWRPGNYLPTYVKITPPEYGTAQRRELGSGDEGTVFWLVAKEAAENSYQQVASWTEDDVYGYSDAQISALKLAEYNLKLVPGIWPIDRMKWFNTALAMAEENRRKYCSAEDFKRAAQMYGGDMYPKE